MSEQNECCLKHKLRRANLEFGMLSFAVFLLSCVVSFLLYQSWRLDSRVEEQNLTIMELVEDIDALLRSPAYVPPPSPQFRPQVTTEELLEVSP